MGVKVSRRVGQGGSEPSGRQGRDSVHTAEAQN